MAAYIVTVKHDKGTKRIRVNAASEDGAKFLVCQVERCPDHAITNVRLAAYNKKTDTRK
jgi:hypothetical protein